MKIINKEKEVVVYKLFSKECLVYVGQTVNLQNRLESHIKDKVFDRVEYILVEPEDADSVEAYLIIEHRPPQNKRSRRPLFSEGRKRYLTRYAGQVPSVAYHCGELAPKETKTLVDFDGVGPEATNSTFEDCVHIPFDLIGGCFIENTSTGEVARLSLMDMATVAVLQRRSEWPSQDYIASESQVDRKTVNRLHRKLVSIGHDGLNVAFNFMDLLSQGFRVYSTKKVIVGTTRGHSNTTG